MRSYRLFALAGQARLFTWGLILAAGASTAAAGQRSDWLAGSALRRQLDRPVSVTWLQHPLRGALDGLAKAQRTCVFVDRRIDPDRRMDLALGDVPLRETWNRVAAKIDAGVTQLGPVTYFGPKATTRRLRTVALLRKTELRQLPKQRHKTLVRTLGWKWEDLSTPRELIAQLAGEANLRIEGQDRVPHDLWAAADLPPLAWTDRLTLVIAGFDLTYAISKDGMVLRLVPMPGEVSITRGYDVGRRPENVRAKLIKFLPPEDVKVSRGKLYVRGLVEDQEFVAAALRGERPKRAVVRPGKTMIKRFVAKEATLGAVIARLAKQLHLEVDMDAAKLKKAGISLEQPVSVSINDGTLDDLLKAVFAPVGLSYRLQDGRLVLRPAKL